MVWLLTSGFDKKPIVKIKTSGISKNNMPTLRLVISPIPPTMKGKTAPPAIPEHKIPDKDPWCSFTELSAKEKIIEYITDIKNPIIGKPIKAISEEPNTAATKQTIVIKVENINILRLSINFKSSSPKIHPKVNIAQK